MWINRFGNVEYFSYLCELFEQTYVHQDKDTELIWNIQIKKLLRTLDIC